MKKLLTTLALAGVAGSTVAFADLDGVSLAAKVGYESEFVFRGKEHSDGNIQTRVYGEYQLPVQGANAAVYAGGFLMSPLTQAANAAVLNFGAKTEIEKILLDAGYNYYGYPNAANTPQPAGGLQNAANNRPVYSDSNEIYVGAAFGQWKNIATPSIYFYYDFDLQQLTTELAVKRVFKGDDYGIAGAELILSGFFGYVQAGQANGDQRAALVPQWNNSYGYVGGTADIAYNVTASTKVGFGIRYTYNNDGTGSITRPMLAGNTESNFYYGVWGEFRY